MVDASGVSYPITDQRNTPSAWVDPSGALSLAQYGAFGEEGPANLGRIGFTGQMRLSEIGLDYHFEVSWARFYDPQIGRFLTPDPAGLIDGPNLYVYALNDPINNVDPTGLQTVTCTIDFSREIVQTNCMSEEIVVPSSPRRSFVATPGFNVFFNPGNRTPEQMPRGAPGGSTSGGDRPGMLEMMMMMRGPNCAARERDLRDRTQTLPSFNQTLRNFTAVQFLLGGPGAAGFFVDGRDFLRNLPSSPNRFGFPLAAAAIATESGFGGLRQPFQEGRDRLAADTLRLVGEFTATCLN